MLFKEFVARCNEAVGKMGDHEINISRVLAVETEDNRTKSIRLAFPLAGLVAMEEEVVFMISTEGHENDWLVNFGEVVDLGVTEVIP